jgi:hypothetical protein
MTAIDINLNHQERLKSSKRTYKIGAVLMLLSALVSLVAIFYESKVFMWVYVVYFLLYAIILYSKSKGKGGLDLLGKSYFRINDQGISCKMSLFSKKTIDLKWEEIDDMRIKLFEIQLKINNQWISINLEKLSDDNLKNVKEMLELKRKEIETGPALQAV